MSSMLAFTAGPVETNFARYQDHENLSLAKSSRPVDTSQTTTRYLRNGLPTPPTSKVMGSLSIPHNRAAYPPTYLHSANQPCASTQFMGQSTNGLADGHPNSQDGRRLSLGPIKQEMDYRKDGQIAAHLQIPESVNSSKGSLAELAAEMTCLFWFDSSETLAYAEGLALNTMPDRGLSPDVPPTIGFRKWVTTILSTTQVGKDVVMLALMFIYRLKKFKPDVTGKKGSEFRLLTIALMLGNKYLDDNTYTNKTWAEVSGIPVNEIHTMEVEFLSNMRYNLYASEKQWKEWIAQLGRLSSFYNKALRYEASQAVSPITPIIQTLSNKIPSPPSGSKHTSNWPTLPHPLNTLPRLPRSPNRQATVSALQFERKRSLDTSYEMPSAKRAQYAPSASSNLSSVLTPTSTLTPDSTVFTPSTYNSASLDLGRLPQLPAPQSNNYHGRPGVQLTPLTLPHSRAMSAVYPSTSYTQTASPESLYGPNSSQTTGSSSNYGLPLSRPPSHMGSAHTSPVNFYSASTPTRPGLSPSYFLMNRSSPYRPVRNVNTLLYPPPSAAMQAPSKNIDHNQMQYQPLSKNTTQIHTGPVPRLHYDSWQTQFPTPVERPYRPY